MSAKKPLGITELVLRDAHQSLLATRMRIDDMLPIAGKLDKIGFWSIESWGGATFDACIRYLGEDPWERIRRLKAAMPNTPQQMLFRGQNILGYRHYADDLVEKFVERCAVNGVDVFRIFDALNDLRNLETAIKATIKVDKHAQGTISYTVSPVHTVDLWVDLGKRIEDMGAHSICIKDMAGLLRPYVASELVSRLKESVDIPIHMQCHATTGLSTATCVKAAEAGIDNIDTAISSMSMTYGHSPTESLVAILEGTDRDTGLDLQALEEVATYFREVRKKYAKFEGDVRAQQSRHVLDADRVSTHVLDALAEIHPQIDRVHRANRVRDGSLGVLVDLDRRLYRRLEVPEIVQRVENPEDIDAVDRTALDELLHQVVSVMAVAENILAAKQHLLWRIRHGGFQAANALPRVFSEVANAGIERRPTPGLDRPEADLVELAGDRQHVVDSHTRGEQALVRVTKHEFGNTEGFLFAHK